MGAAPPLLERNRRLGRGNRGPRAARRAGVRRAYASIRNAEIRALDRRRFALARARRTGKDRDRGSSARRRYLQSRDDGFAGCVGQTRRSKPCPGWRLEPVRETPVRGSGMPGRSAAHLLCPRTGPKLSASETLHIESRGFRKMQSWAVGRRVPSPPPPNCWQGRGCFHQHFPTTGPGWTPHRPRSVIFKFPKCSFHQRVGRKFRGSTGKVARLAASGSTCPAAPKGPLAEPRFCDKL